MIIFPKVNSRSSDCAVEYEGIKYSYDHFGMLIHFRKQELESESRKLSEFALVDEVDPFDHWITTLALSAMSVTTAPCTTDMPSRFSSGDIPIISSSNPQSQVHVTSFRKLPFHASRQSCADLSFMGSRIFFTSGTTGSAKAVKLDCENMHSRILTRLKTYSKTKRLISLIPHFSTFGYQFQISQWAAGGSVVLDRDFGHIFKALGDSSVDYLVGAPNHYRHLVEEIATRKLTQFTGVDEVIIGGGALSVKLYVSVKSAFDARIKCQFGATETGTWSVNEIDTINDLDFIGQTVDGTEISFDELAGKKYLKIRNSHTVEGYMDNSDLGHFRDGWFYPGDVIEVDAKNKFRVLGREAEVVNVAGVKIDPRIVDDILNEQDSVKDAACFWIEDDLGYPELWAAVVMKEAREISQLYEVLSFKLDGALLPRRLLPVAFIPRAYSGKPQRYMMSVKVMAMANPNEQRTKNGQ